MRSCRRSRLILFLIAISALLMIFHSSLYFRLSSGSSTSQSVSSHKVAEQARRVTAFDNQKVEEKTGINPKRAGETKGCSVFISVKTGRAYHQTRLPVLLQTWLTYAPNETFFVTDTADDDIARQLTGKHLVVSSCGDNKERSSLCCKMRHELQQFYLVGKDKDWFCHVDDDNYVNVPQLVRLLSKYDPNKDIYIGRPRLAQPLDLDWTFREAPAGLGNFKREPFWFGTGGAGFCLSRHLAKRMEPYIRDGKFEMLCEFTRLPDDCTMGFLSESVLGVKMIHSQLLHSHLEKQNVPQEQLEEQVTFGHGLLGNFDSLIPIQGPFTREQDPTRFKSYHCLLNPHLEWCPQ